MSTALPITPSHLPKTFRERGVAIPFTTPMLAGARIRDTANGTPDLLLPNPSGNRGVYVLPATRLRQQYRPTVHDIMLLKRVAAQPVLDPAAVRAAAMAVAQDGFAGPEARVAAETAAKAERSQVLTCEFQMLSALVEQVEPGGNKITSIAAQAAELERRGRGVLSRLGRSFGCSGVKLGELLAALAAVFTSIGIAVEDTQACVPRLIERMAGTRDNMSGAFDAGDDTAGSVLGKAVTGCMNVVMPYARDLLASARTLAAEPLNLLSQWIANPAQVVALVNRAEWVMDGWEQICLLWQSAPDNEARRAALLEMAQVIPLLPQEAREWSARPLPSGALSPSVRVACQNDEWRSGGNAIALIARNETLRAMSLSLP